MMYFLLGLTLFFSNVYSNQKVFGVDQIVNKESLTSDNLAYVLNFDLSRYKLCSVENLGKFYIDVDDTKDMIKGHLGRGLLWEPKINALIRYFCKPGSIAIDAGTFIGSHTIAMSKSVGSLGKVIGFEPVLKIFSECVINLTINECFNTTVYNYALSNKDHMSTMSVLDGGEAIAHLIKRNALYSKPVRVKTLDSFELKNVSLIKIDVEGLEKEVIEGAVKLIRENKPVIIIEANDPALNKSNMVPKYIESLGYVCLHIEKSDWLALPIP